MTRANTPGRETSHQADLTISVYTDPQLPHAAGTLDAPPELPPPPCPRRGSLIAYGGGEKCGGDGYCLALIAG